MVRIDGREYTPDQAMQRMFEHLVQVFAAAQAPHAQTPQGLGAAQAPQGSGGSEGPAGPAAEPDQAPGEGASGGLRRASDVARAVMDAANLCAKMHVTAARVQEQAAMQRARDEELKRRVAADIASGGDKGIVLP